MKMDIKKSGSQFDALFDNAAIGIIVVEAKGFIILANQFSLKQFGYDEGELLGQKIEILIPPRYKTTHIQHREHYHGHSAHSRPMGLGMDLFGIKKDGTEFPVEVSLSPYQTEKGQFSMAFISDISVRKKSEIELLQLNADLEQKVEERTLSLSLALEKEKDLNELKSRFVSMASHEFRTPLSTILSSAYLMSKYTVTEDQPKREKHIQRIISSVDMLNETLNDFLSVGKIEEGRIQVRFSDVNVQDLVNDLLNEMHPLLKKDQEVIYHHQGDASFYLDFSLFKHILMNLLSNAIKFSSENTTIQVRTGIEANNLHVSVKDTGVGISKMDQEHLFERFFRGGNVSNIQGTGLGLHIVAKYAELMNGSIECNSGLEKGTEFIVNFKPINQE
ncbi:MAG: PAS domain-containing sensor histidine kinase [Flavipsychrobacter sp.]|nr:PAS domain-containing sensor histidine kinase [Flavipsychrobacter sp.]